MYAAGWRVACWWLVSVVWFGAVSIARFDTHVSKCPVFLDGWLAGRCVRLCSFLGAAGGVCRSSVSSGVDCSGVCEL